MHQEPILYPVKCSIKIYLQLIEKRNIGFKRPIYVGMTILDLSKLFMYDFHYNFMLKNMTGKI